jgi:hypothetical protein
MVTRLGQAFAGKWKEAFARLEMAYNQRSWQFVTESHAPEDSLFSLMDKSDGASFLLRLELLSESLTEDEEIPVDYFEEWALENTEAIAESLLEPIEEKGMVRERIGRRVLNISERTFHSFAYVVINPKFGIQFLEQAFIIEQGTIVMIQFTWPYSEVPWPGSFPIKLQVLVEGLNVRLEG